ncbi:MAG: hypothetical protein RLZZ40_1117 [Actinomycetota bacterium]|jgi:glycerol uptake facilitator-like aquaporin
MTTLTRSLLVEFLGTALLVGAQIGTGYQLTYLTGNPGFTLLGISIVSALALGIGITVGGPISGGHFNPAVTIGLTIAGHAKTAVAVPYIAAQLLGGFVAAVAANFLWDGSLVATTAGEVPTVALLASELLCTVVLVGLIVTMVRRKGGEGLNVLVPLWIGTAILLSPTGCMANPAVTFGHMFTDSFASAGVAGVGPFVGIQLVGAVIVAVVANTFAPRK